MPIENSSSTIEKVEKQAKKVDVALANPEVQNEQEEISSRAKEASLIEEQESIEEVESIEELAVLRELPLAKEIESTLQNGVLKDIEALISVLGPGILIKLPLFAWLYGPISALHWLVHWKNYPDLAKQEWFQNLGLHKKPELLKMIAKGGAKGLDYVHEYGERDLNRGYMIELVPAISRTWEQKKDIYKRIFDSDQFSDETFLKKKETTIFAINVNEEVLEEIMDEFNEIPGILSSYIPLDLFQKIWRIDKEATLAFARNKNKYVDHQKQFIDALESAGKYELNFLSKYLGAIDKYIWGAEELDSEVLYDFYLENPRLAKELFKSKWWKKAYADVKKQSVYLYPTLSEQERNTLKSHGDLFGKIDKDCDLKALASFWTKHETRLLEIKNSEWFKNKTIWTKAGLINKLSKMPDWLADFGLSEAQYLGGKTIQYIKEAQYRKVFISRFKETDAYKNASNYRKEQLYINALRVPIELEEFVIDEFSLVMEFVSEGAIQPLHYWSEHYEKFKEIKNWDWFINTFGSTRLNTLVEGARIPIEWWEDDEKKRLMRECFYHKNGAELMKLRIENPGIVDEESIKKYATFLSISGAKWDSIADVKRLNEIVFGYDLSSIASMYASLNPDGKNFEAFHAYVKAFGLLKDQELYSTILRLRTYESPIEMEKLRRSFATLGDRLLIDDSMKSVRSILEEGQELRKIGMRWLLRIDASSWTRKEVSFDDRVEGIVGLDASTELFDVTKLALKEVEKTEAETYDVSDGLKKSLHTLKRARKRQADWVAFRSEVRFGIIDTLKEFEAKLEAMPNEKAKKGLQMKIDTYRRIKLELFETESDEEFLKVLFLKKNSFILNEKKNPEIVKCIKEFIIAKQFDNNWTQVDEFLAAISVNCSAPGGEMESGRVIQFSEILSEIEDHSGAPRRLFNFKSVHEMAKKISNIKSSGRLTSDVYELHPSRGLLAEVSGFLADACWTSKTTIVKDNPNMTALTIAKINENAPVELLGSSLVFEVTGDDGRTALMIRGLNPQDKMLKTISADSISDQVVEYVKEVAKKKGIKTVIACFEKGIMSNRPAIYNYFQVKYKDAPKFNLSEKFDFNGYDITKKCQVIWEE